MLDSAEFILAKRGLQGATLPRIAAHAKLSPASVYRRFREKLSTSSSVEQVAVPILPTTTPEA